MRRKYIIVFYHTVITLCQFIDQNQQVMRAAYLFWLTESNFAPQIKTLTSMKRIFFGAAVVMALACSTSVSAQDVKGKTFVNAGIGIGTIGFSGTGGLPVTLSAEHGFTDKISGGLFMGIVQRKYYADYKYNYKVIGVRASYHFNELLQVEVPKLDLYGGASIFYRGYTLKYEGLNGKEKLTDSNIGVGIHAGARYMFSQNIGGYAELGYGISPLQLGVTAVF